MNLKCVKLVDGYSFGANQTELSVNGAVITLFFIVVVSISGAV